MSTPSGDLHVIDFKTNQIVSAVQPKDYWDDKRHWEIKNNIDTLEFRVFENTDHAATLVQQNLVLKEVRGGRIVPYVITETEKDSKDRSLMVYASGEWIQLAKAGIIEPQKIESKTLKQCMEIALKGTKWKIGKTEHDGAHSMEVEEFTNPLDLLKQIAASFEIEIQYRAEVVGSKIVGRYVDMVKRRGRDTRKEVTFGKDLIGIKRIENSQNICTALLGFVKKENGEFITISSINKGVPYLVDDAAYQRWNENGKHKFAFYTPQTDDQNMSPERLLTLMKTEMSKLVNASVSYGVDVQNIARIPNLSHEEINEGDTIRIIDEGFTPKLYIEARAIAGDESFKDPTQDNYVFGDYREIVDQNDELRRLYQKILSSLYDKVPQELFDQLNNKVKEQNKDIIDAKDKADQAQKESQTAKDLAETTQKYIEQNMVDIIEQPTAPTENLRDGKTLWIDSSDPENKVQKLWKGGQWQRVTPDTGPLKQSIKDVKEDIETAKTELNQKVQSVEGKAQEIAGQIVDVQKQVNGKVDQTWIDNQLKDKADKSGVYTKDEIKDGFIGKQIYETDKQGNVQNFKDINTSIGQTNEALKQKAEKSELTKTNDGLTKLQNKTNEIETTANGTKQKLSELETTVNNTNVGGRNYVLDSDKFISPPNTVQNFKFVNDLKDLQGKQVTLSVYVEIKNAKTGVNPSNRIGFEPSIRYSDNSTQHLGAWLRMTDGMNFKGIISTTVWTKDIEILKSEQNAVYIQCGGDYVKVGRPKIEIGNKVTDWTPAPEDQVTTTDFTKKTVEIETTIKGINTTVSNVQNEQGKLTERMTKSEQTADGFKTSIESLTKKDTEISNKLNTVESNVEGTKQTISDIQQTTSNLTKTTNEIKQTADTNKQTISQLKTDVSNISVGSINLSSGSEAGLNKQNITGTWSDSKQMTISDKINFRNKTFTISFLFTGKMTKLNTNPWFGVETAITYADGEQEWKSVRADSSLKINVDYKDEPLSATFKTKDKDITLIRFYYSGRNIDGNLNSHHAKFEEGNIRTTWQSANEEVTSKADFTKITNEIKQTVDTNSQTISTVQKDQGAMQSTLNQVKQTTDSNSQTITTLSQMQGKQGEVIQQNKSDITQLNNQMKSKVSDTQMQEYVGGLGSTNLLFNAAFEDRVINATTGVVTNRNPSTTKWSVVGTGSGITIVPESARHHEGYNSVKITATGQTASKWSGIMQRVPAAQNGGDYVFSAWVYVQDKNTLDNGGAIKLQFFNGANAVSTFVQTEFKDLLVNNSWILVSVKITSPNVAITHLQGDIWVRQNGTIWVSQPQLQQGSTRSTFMENPKDYANYDQLVGEIGKKVATSDFNSKVSTIETSINQQSNRIDLKAEKNDVYNKIDSDGRYGSKAIVESHTSQLSVMSNEINSTVKKGNIISSINQTAEQIQIQANKINLVGYVTAEHLKGDILEGMNIRTSRQSNDPRWVEIMKSNVRLKEDGLVRSYWGFYTRNDGGVQPSLFLGKDSTDTVGSIAITQVTPNKTDFLNAWGTIGIVDEVSNNMFKTNATVGFFRDSGGRLELSAGGHVLIDSKGLINVRSDDFLLLRAKRTMRLETTWDNGGTNINMEATKSFNVMAHSQIWLASNEEHFYDNNAGKFYFRNKNKPSNQNSVLIDDDNANADIRLAYIRVRASHVSGYQNSLQVKNYNGTEFRDLECRSLTVNGNFYNKSTKNIKANIRDLPFDPVEKIMALQPRSYNLKTEVEKLYKMREEKEEGEEPFTTKDIVANYGFIAEETDEIFKSEDGKAVNIYGTLAIHIAATQKMHIELKEVKEENKQLKEQVSMLINEVSTLKDLVRKLIDEKPEQP
ncbi:tail fiber domain-containing protein [Bacillus cereus]|uniref:phage tail spike protein n=1 Tax=Bacillus TaxID=1386 RepID=UPI0024BACA5E|nr:phage tail spike protein [Bacillus cereus]WHS74568.1 tail fiber domain-containing protein [Bacillus cereus]